MASLKNILAYLLQNYPHSSDLSNARVTKMIYLSDWRHSIQNGSQITPIGWVFNNYGPFVWDVLDTARANPDLFEVSEKLSPNGTTKRELAFKKKNYAPELAASEKAAVDHVMEVTKDLDWEEFIRLVYSTHPVVTSERFSTLNLVQKAEDYKKLRS